MSNELNIFSASTGSSENALLYGAASARAWVSGSLRADDGLDFSAEFDAQVSAKLGGEVAGGLARLGADLSGRAHAGVRLQAGIPLDLFEAAGVIARLRLEASVDGQAKVSASMSLGELQRLVLDAFPADARPYVRILLDEAKVGASVWARGSFAAMAVAELLAVAELFPQDGTGAGVSAWFNYGFGWGYGGGWGVVVNTGFDTPVMLRRMSAQAGADLARALASYREQAGLADDDPLLPLLDAAQTVLPMALDAVVTWCRDEWSAGSPAEHESLLDAVLTAVRRLAADILAPRLLRLALDFLLAEVGGLDVAAVRRFWADLTRALAILDDLSQADGLDAVGAVAQLLLTAVPWVAADRAALVRSAIRCAVALTVLVVPDSGDPATLRGVLAADGAPGRPLSEVAAQVLLDELHDLLVSEDLVPDWLADLMGSTASLVATVAASPSGGMTRNEAADVLRRALDTVTTALTDAGVWDYLATVMPPDIVRALQAEARILGELCVALVDGDAVDAHATREAVSTGILILIGRPLSTLVHSVATRGFEAVPPALRSLADELDAGDTPVDLEASWNELGRQVLGATVGFPAAQLLRHVSRTAEQWANTMLPGELNMLDRFLLADGLVDDVLASGTREAIAAYKRQLLPVFGQHVVDHVTRSLEFLARDSVNLFTDMSEASVNMLLRALELSAVVSFRAAEAAVIAAEQAASQLQAREQELIRETDRLAADFLAGVARVADTIRALDAQVGAALTDWLIEQSMGPASASTPEWLRGGLRAIVTAAVNAHTGGALQATSHVTRVLADTLQVSAEALRVTAESPEGSAVGMRALLESLLRSDQVPSVEIPIGIDLPNPVLPFILPSIHIDITHVSLPANVVAGVVTTLIFDAVGVGPLIRALDDTAMSLRATRTALQTVRDAIRAGTASRMRAAMDRAQPTALLSVEVVGPRPGSTAAPQGEIVFRIPGATWTFVDPRGEGLPAEAISRVQVQVNGRLVPLTDIQWRNDGAAMEGHLQYAVQGGLVSDPNRPAVTVPPGPVALVVLVTDGVGVTSAQAAWYVIIPSEQSVLITVREPWFPIVRTRPFIPVNGRPVLAAPLIRPLQRPDLQRRDRDGREPGAPPRPSPRG
ncbi:hypothetical protein [Streptomyces sp. NPDC052012]|uniref:hypothetical protein n=1 Tax=Streptomyces sp. NPDC052012 TaxID=3155051 RepID=UPI00344DD5CC